MMAKRERKTKKMTTKAKKSLKDEAMSSIGNNFIVKLCAGLGALILSVSSIMGGGERGLSSPNSAMFLTAADIPKSYYKEKKLIYGQVIKVVDGDTLRMRHLPSLLSGTKFKGKLSDETIMVRVAAVDSPETAKYGQDGQPFAEEAKAFTSSIVGKKIKVVALAVDRYQRLLGVVKYDDFGEKDLSEELLRRGLAVVYRQGGAQYGGKKEEYEGLEVEARRGRRGIWSQRGGGESPAEYKKKIQGQKAKKGGSKEGKLVSAGL